METPANRPGSTMKTIDKAITLLGLFTTETPSFRLSDIARAAEMDKVTAMRVLKSLVTGGLLEQHPETKRYSLGAAILRLARIRETATPTVSVLQPIVDQLAETTGESAHAALMSGNGLTTIALCEPNRATRVWIDPAQVLPIHATASGLAFLAYASEETAAELISRAMSKRYTEETVTDGPALRQRLDETRKRGCALSAGTLQSDVTGVAAPIFDWHGQVMASIAVACVRSRLDAEAQDRIQTEVLKASVEATRAFGGQPPASFLAIIKSTMA